MSNEPNRDIKLTERIFYWFSRGTFFHTNKNGWFCHSLESSSWHRIDMKCEQCGYKASNKEKFIMKLMEFSE
jgi:hypothetical protein